MRTHHHRIRDMIHAFREALRQGDVRLARRRFRSLARAIRDHFTWEEHELVDPLRGRLTVYDLQMIQRDTDAHRKIRAVLERIEDLLDADASGRDAGVLDLAHRAEELLESHRVVFETQLRSRLAELLSSSAEAGAIEAMRPGRRAH